MRRSTILACPAGPASTRIDVNLVSCNDVCLWLATHWMEPCRRRSNPWQHQDGHAGVGRGRWLGWRKRRRLLLRTGAPGPADRVGNPVRPGGDDRGTSLAALRHPGDRDIARLRRYRTSNDYRSFAGQTPGDRRFAGGGTRARLCGPGLGPGVAQSRVTTRACYLISDETTTSTRTAAPVAPVRWRRWCRKWPA